MPATSRTPEAAPDPDGDAGHEGDADTEQTHHEQPVGPPGAGDRVKRGLERADGDATEEASCW